ncbi:dipeptidase PepV [Weizmannia sp. CD-2023]|uniref:dipeptidase PepV n=1 Tax=Weizmannia sp. CD-2023 TaxID=3037263 RepID=UPI002E245CD8|nr:dipeptidase PepV [Weizmannia sp. CD-2023]MED4919846.1 dipeptidase PepV [Weizmannia sp. CD-2023]
MADIHWMEEVLKRKEDLIRDLQGILQIRSVLDEANTTEEAPLGQGVREALQYMLDLGEKDGFKTKNVQNLAGHLEMGEGEDILGILGHVDVVPEGDGWTVDPYSGTVKDGKIYARGSSDDKGPTMAAYYGMKIVNELGVPLEKRVRLIVGTDEESNWRCMDAYFANEEMPAIGFSPDADFPIIYAEKGIADFDIIQDPEKTENTGQAELLSFESGRRYNMVPDYAEARIVTHGEQTELLQKFQDFQKETGLRGQDFVDDGILILKLEGVSAHGAEPENGKSAGLYLAKFLNNVALDRAGAKFIKTLNQFFGRSRGEYFGIGYKDEVSGELTINIGIMSYHQEKGGRIGLNMRYPVTFDLEAGKTKIVSKLKEDGLRFDHFSDQKPHYVDKNDPLITTLAKVYEEQTGEEAKLLAIGGGTYARTLKKGVAFGALFPGREDVMHQKDEYMYVEDLLKATAIYAQSIYELAGKHA